MLLNISKKINPSFVEVLSIINTITMELDIPFFIVGAMARDIIFEHCYGIKSPRRTLDIDLGIRIPDWNKFVLLTDALTMSGHFQKTKLIYRYTRDDISVDIIPFGPIADEKMEIRFPTEENIVMSILGFEEVYCCSIKVRLRDTPKFDLKIPTVPGLCITKLISWNEKYPERKRDAQDLLFIIKNYENIGTESVLYDKEAPMLKEEGFDVRLASIRLLGREIKRMSDEKTLIKIKQILTNETDDNATKMIVDMRNNLREDFDEILTLLKKLKQGVFYI